MGKMVLISVCDDLGCQGRGAEGSRDGGKRRGIDDGRAAFDGLVNELFTNDAPPEDLGFNDIDFVVMLFADLGTLLGIGPDFVRNEDFIHEDLEVLGEAISLGAAGF